jgi:hypothetical protein
MQQDFSAVIEPSTFQCVPFGCQVIVFLMEYARLRAVGECEVIVVSNGADVVLQSHLPETRWHHLGFMFVEEELVLPGITIPLSSKTAIHPSSASTSTLAAVVTASSRRSREAIGEGEGVQGVRRTILKVRSSSHLGGANQLLRRHSASRVSKDVSMSHEVAAELQHLQRHDRSHDSQETQLQDSQIDGEVWHGSGSPAGREAEDRFSFADTQVIVDAPTETVSLQSDAYADTQVDFDVDASEEVPRIRLANAVVEVAGDLDEAYAETQVDCHAVSVNLRNLRRKLQETSSINLAPEVAVNAPEPDSASAVQVIQESGIDANNHKTVDHTDID